MLSSLCKSTGLGELQTQAGSLRYVELEIQTPRLAGRDVFS